MFGVSPGGAFGAPGVSGGFGGGGRSGLGAMLWQDVGLMYVFHCPGGLGASARSMFGHRHEHVPCKTPTWEVIEALNIIEKPTVPSDAAPPY